MLYSFQVRLHYTEKALRLIAKKAMAKNTGARGLRSLIESILTEAMYEVCVFVYACAHLSFNYQILAWCANTNNHLILVCFRFQILR